MHARMSVNPALLLLLPAIKSANSLAAIIELIIAESGHLNSSQNMFMRLKASRLPFKVHDNVISRLMMREKLFCSLSRLCSHVFSHVSDNLCGIIHSILPAFSALFPNLTHCHTLSIARYLVGEKCV